MTYGYQGYGKVWAKVAPDGAGMVGGPPPSDWIVSTGIWIDAKFWIDTEIWVD
jgi:hypothetical protein